jgi:hypothetical protein
VPRIDVLDDAIRALRVRVLGATGAGPRAGRPDDEPAIGVGARVDPSAEEPDLGAGDGMRPQVDHAGALEHPGAEEHQPPALDGSIDEHLLATLSRGRQSRPVRLVAGSMARGEGRGRPCATIPRRPEGRGFAVI